MKSHKEITKILAIQLRQMGDVIMTTPAIRQLRKIFPDAQLDFMTETLGANVYRFNRNVDNIIEVDRTKNIISIIGLFHKIYRCSYDLVLDFFSNPSSA
jgi:heptosyltransferase-3